MFCFNCGSKLMDDAVYCDNCGTKVLDEKADTNTSYESDNEHTSKFSSDEVKNFGNTINMEGVKEKIKKGTDGIKKSGVFNTMLNLIKSPVVTGNNIVRDFGYKEMAILAGVFLIINMITSLISLAELNNPMFGIDFRFVFETIFSRFLIGYIVLFVVNTMICALITGMFLKVGNGQDVVRKGAGVAISVYGISTLVSVIGSLLMPISVVLSLAVYIVGFLVYINLYFTLFRENSKTSSEASLILPVIALVLFGFITLFISVEFISRQAVGGAMDLLNMFDMYNIL